MQSSSGKPLYFLVFSICSIPLTPSPPQISTALAVAHLDCVGSLLSFLHIDRAGVVEGAAGGAAASSSSSPNGSGALSHLQGSGHHHHHGSDEEREKGGWHFEDACCCDFLCVGGVYVYFIL